MNNPVEQYISELEHPLKNEFLEIRRLICNHFPQLTEVIKWNAPSYQINETDFLTFKLFPPKNIQLIFHRGAKVKEQPKDHLISDDSNLLKWAANDRAIATFTTLEEVKTNENTLILIISNWMKALQE
ncbi:MAG: DUF1801 domain-containing protein [Flavobacteriales bacterium]|nr:DUF1801 domain-containing protein [Flavobacteriales bacterium]